MSTNVEQRAVGSVNPRLSERLLSEKLLFLNLFAPLLGVLFVAHAFDDLNRSLSGVGIDDLVFDNLTADSLQDRRKLMLWR